MTTLRDIRKNSSLSTNIIILEMDIQVSTLYSWENGDRLIPINQLHRLLEIYQYPIAQFNFDELIKQYESKKLRVNK